MKHVLVWLIRVYQYLISPWVGNRCRFYPTCSEYARIAIAEHGSARGGWMAVRRGYGPGAGHGGRNRP